MSDLTDREGVNRVITLALRGEIKTYATRGHWGEPQEREVIPDFLGGGFNDEMRDRLLALDPCLTISFTKHSVTVCSRAMRKGSRGPCAITRGATEAEALILALGKAGVVELESAGD